MKGIEFVRFGGLSPVNHKKFYKKDSFHSPPKKKGIFAFIFPYIEDFLWVWKIHENVDGEISNKELKKYHRKNRKQFSYEGELWVHWIKEARQLGVGIEYKKEWVKIHTNNLKKCFKMIKHNDIKQLHEDNFEIIQNPYKRGLGGWMSKDHLEVFIERV